MKCMKGIVAIFNFYMEISMVYWMVFTETIQARGYQVLLRALEVSWCSQWRDPFAEHLLFLAWLAVLIQGSFKFRAKKPPALAKKECEWATQASQPTYNNVPSSLQSLWSWSSHATRHLELTGVSGRAGIENQPRGFWKERTKAMQAKTQEPGFKEWTHWENPACRRASYSAAGLLPQFSERGTWVGTAQLRTQHFSAQASTLETLQFKHLPVFDSEFKHAHYLSLKYS